MAGSNTNTRRRLSKLANDTMTITASPTPATACHNMCKPARCVIELVRSKNNAVSPMPSEKTQ